MRLTPPPTPARIPVLSISTCWITTVHLIQVSPHRTIVAIGDIQVMSTIHAKTGQDRLRLLDVVGTEDGGMYFHSLLWERRSGTEWRKHHQLSQEDLQWQHPNRRWVSRIHRLYAEKGQAVFLMAEGNKPMYPLVVGQATTFYYSWRVWDLLGNREVRRLKDCEDPFEPCPLVDDES